MNTLEYPVSLNPLDATMGFTRDQAVSNLMSAFERIWRETWRRYMTYFSNQEPDLIIGTPIGDQAHPWSTLPPPWQRTDPDWKFGSRRTHAWKRCLPIREQPVSLNLAHHRGIIVGTAEQGVDMSLLRLATNAARHSWKVILFDALGSETRAATFLAAMRQAGHQEIRVFPHQPYDGWRGAPEQVCQRLLQVAPSYRVPTHQYLTAVCLSTILSKTKVTSMDELVRRLADLLPPWRLGPLQPAPHFSAKLRAVRPADLAELLLRFEALSTLLGNSLDGTWSYKDVDAAYLSFNVCGRPLEARTQATFLLADLASYLTETSGGAEHVLLLVNGPELLFDSKQLVPLLASIGHLGGSAFLALPSTKDLETTRLLSHAQTVILHRNTVALDDLSLLLPWDSHGSSTMKAIERLPDNECFVIHHGHVEHARLDPVNIPPGSIRHMSVFGPSKNPTTQATWGEASPHVFPPFRLPIEPPDDDLDTTFPFYLEHFDLAGATLPLPDEEVEKENPLPGASPAQTALPTKARRLSRGKRHTGKKTENGALPSKSEADPTGACPEDEDLLR